MSLSRRLAEWLVALDEAGVPEPQRAFARMRLLDTVGLLLGSSASRPAAIMRTRACEGSGPGKASLLGGPLIQPEWAALAHGVVAHCVDFDDTFPASVVHPGSAIVPVVLAVAEETGAAPDDLVAALAGAYEVAARLARAGGTQFHARGFHASGIFAPVAAAYAAARLMRLSADAMAGAAGLAASMAGGLLAFTEDGAWSKWLHLGWGGFGGILAAKLARDGFRGPMQALDGRYNLFSSFINGTADDADAGLGRVWVGDSALFKYYPAAHVIQPYLDLALALRRAKVIDARTIEAVRCRVAPWAVPIVCEPLAQKRAPGSPVEAIASLPYNLAYALIEGGVGLDALEEANWQRADIRALAGRVSYTADPTLSGFAAQLTIDAGGESHAQSGDAAPADAARVTEKFRSLARRSLAPDDIAALEAAVVCFDANAIGFALRRATI